MARAAAIGANPTLRSGHDIPDVIKRNREIGSDGSERDQTVTTSSTSSIFDPPQESTSESGGGILRFVAAARTCR